MGVQTQIDRLASAKAAMKTAIQGKGVAVPDGAKLDAFAALIESIEAGSGGSFDLSNFLQNITDVISFSFTPVIDGAGYHISKPSKNSIPRMGFVYADDISYAYDKSILCFWLYTAVDPYTDVSSGANLQVHFYTSGTSTISTRLNNAFLIKIGNTGGCLESNSQANYINIKSQTLSNNKAIFKADVQYKGFVLFGD